MRELEVADPTETAQQRREAREADAITWGNQRWPEVDVRAMNEGSSTSRTNIWDLHLGQESGNDTLIQDVFSDCVDEQPAPDGATTLLRLVRYASLKGWTRELEYWVRITLERRADPLMLNATGECALCVAGQSWTTPIAILKKMILTDIELRVTPNLADAAPIQREGGKHGLCVWGLRAWNAAGRLSSTAEKLEFIYQNRLAVPARLWPCLVHLIEDWAFDYCDNLWQGLESSERILSNWAEQARVRPQEEIPITRAWEEKKRAVSETLYKLLLRLCLLEDEYRTRLVG
jgi:hypothetical protein